LDLNISIQLQVYIENSVSLKTRKFRKFSYSIFSTTLHITDIHLAAHKYASLPFNTFGNAARTGPELLLVGRLIPSTVSSPLPPLHTHLNTTPTPNFYYHRPRFRNNFIPTRLTAFFPHCSYYDDDDDDDDAAVVLRTLW
jgi:hypothetical protein